MASNKVYITGYIEEHCQQVFDCSGSEDNSTPSEDEDVEHEAISDLLRSNAEVISMLGESLNKSFGQNKGKPPVNKMTEASGEFIVFFTKYSKILNHRLNLIIL